MQILELFAVIFALLAVIYQWREHAISWWFVLVSSVLYCVLFWRSHLAWEALLQIVFVLLALRGIITWAGLYAAPVPQINERSRMFHITAIVAALIVTPLLSWIVIELRQTALPVAVADASVFAFSVLAVWLTERKVLSCWIYWIIIDLFSSMLYLSRGLYLTAALYVLYIPLAFLGYRTWRESCLKKGPPGKKPSENCL